MSRREGLALAGLVALAAALRFPTLGLQSFWHDESVTAVVVLRPGPGNVLDAVSALETTPPLFYWLLWGWSKLFGGGDVALRSLSAIVGLATVPVAWAIGRKLVSTRVGLVAAALVATSPLLVKYSQETRAYALLAFLGALSFLLFLLALDEPSRRRLAAWSTVSALAVATHYFAVFLIGVQAIWLLVRSPNVRRRVAMAAVVPVAIGGALLPLAIDQQPGDRTSWITDRPLHVRLEETGHEFVKGVLHAPGSGLGVLAVILVALGGGLLARAGYRERRAGALPLAVGLAAAGAPLMLALLGLDFFYFRNLLASFVPLVAAVAIGFGARRSGVAGIGAAAGLAAVWVAINVAIFSDESFHRDNWKDASKRLGPAVEARAILLRPGWAGAAIRRYGHLTFDAPATGIRTRELVFLGQLPSPLPPDRLPGLPAFRAVERYRVQNISFVRYRSPRPRVLRPKMFAKVDAGLRFEPAPPGGST